MVGEMNTVRTPDTPPWPDWTVTARIASVASILARYREREARERQKTIRHTFGHREADSALDPVIATLRDLAAASGADADALAKAADHLAAVQRCLHDAWWDDGHAKTWDDHVKAGNDHVKVVSTALAAAREHLQKVEGSAVEAARAAIGRADEEFRYLCHGVTGGHYFALDVHDPHVVAADTAACAAFALAAAELSAAHPALATSAGGGAASAAQAADLAASLAASLAHAMTDRPALG